MRPSVHTFGAVGDQEVLHLARGQPDQGAGAGDGVQGALDPAAAVLLLPEEALEAGQPGPVAVAADVEVVDAVLGTSGTHGELVELPGASVQTRVTRKGSEIEATEPVIWWVWPVAPRIVAWSSKSFWVASNVRPMFTRPMP